MSGRRISKEEFKKNYTDAPKSGPDYKRRKKWSIKMKMMSAVRGIEREKVIIHNPVYLRYIAAINMTDKAYCFRFGDGTENWFPIAYCRVYKRIGVIAVPRVFARERKLLGFEI